jgi:hypothetical protein
MAKKVSWGWIIFGIVAFTVLVGVIFVAVAGVVVYQQFGFKSTPATERNALEQFEAQARRFHGQTPLIVLEDGEPVVHKPDPTRKKRSIEALHVMVWDPSEERVVSLSIPFWLIRMTNGRPIKLSANGDGHDVTPHLKITAEDLERFGPGLILEHRDEDGQRVLVWAK